MEYMVFLIYAIVISQWIFSGKEKAKATYSTQGYESYKVKGIINCVFGFVGLLCFQLFLRDKGIIPAWSFWVGAVGFIIITLLGMINIIKMMLYNH